MIETHYAIALCILRDMNQTSLQELPTRLHSIGFLPGSAALSVVLYHAIFYGDQIPQGHLWFSTLVAILSMAIWACRYFSFYQVFAFICDGPEITRKPARTTLNFLEFWKRRLYRLYPPYFVTLCLSMALVVVAYALHKNVPLVINYPQPRPL